MLGLSQLHRKGAKLRIASGRSIVCPRNFLTGDWVEEHVGTLKNDSGVREGLRAEWPFFVIF